MMLYKCDRCGKVSDTNTTTPIKEEFSIFSGWTQKELCWDCIKELKKLDKKFLKEKPK